MMATGPGSTADRTAQNDSEGFVSRYNKFATLSLKTTERTAANLPIIVLHTSLDLADNRDISVIPRRKLPSNYCMRTDRLWKVNTYVAHKVR